MIEFIFDLQRFTIASQAELEQAIADAETGATITLTGNIIDGTGFTIDKNITIDFGTYTYTTSGSITINYNVTATFQNGTINFTDNATVENNYVLTLDKMALSGGSVNATGTINAIKGTTITLNEGQSLAYNGTTYKATARDKTVVFEFQGENGTPYVKGLNNGSEFTAKTSTKTITYTVPENGAGLFASDGTTTKYYTGGTPQITKSIQMSNLDFSTSENLQGVIETTTDYNKTTLIISNAKTSAMKTNDKFIVFSNDYETRYGLLEKTADDSFKLTKDDKATGTLDAIKITGNYKVDFEANNFKNIPITVSNLNEFTVLDNNAFTVSGQQTVSVATAQNIGLTNGNIITAANDQTIGTSNYTISGYTDSKSTNNGIYVSANNDGGATVGGIDNGESFTVTDSNGNPTTYKMNDFGLVDKNFQKVYMGESVQTGNAISVDLSKLADGMRAFITPKDNVLTVGGNNNFSAVVLSTDNPSAAEDIGGVKKYAELEAVNSSPTSYHLKTVTNGATFKDAIDIVSVASGQTTIDTALVKNDINIQTKDVTFTVQNTGSASYFVVDGSSQNAPTVTNATELTLLSGTMTATTSNKIIHLGTTGVIFHTTGNNMKVSVSDDGSYVIKATAGDTFTLGKSTDSHTYTIGDTPDDMIFTVGNNGTITISNLGTAGEILTVDGSTYTVSDVGFIRQDARGKLNLWTGGENSGPSLNGGSVTADSLLKHNEDNWKHALATVSSNGAATLSFDIFSGAKAVTLVGDNYNKFFGNVENQSGTYVLSTLQSNYYTRLNNIYLESGGVVSAGANLTGIILQSDDTTLSITDDESNGYQVTLSSNGTQASVSSGETATLISGKLKVDSTFKANVLNKAITGKEGSIIINSDSKDATISVLDTATNNSFKIGTTDYTFSAVGLTRDNNGSKEYLLGSNDDTVTLKKQVIKGSWGGLLAADSLTLDASTKNALIVNDTTDPVKLYADYTQSTKTLSKSAKGMAWDPNNTIHVDNTTVTLTSDFVNAPIQGLESKSVFLVSNVTTSSNTFTVTDASTGVTVSKDATEVSLQSGIIAPANGQTILTPDEATISGAASVKVGVDGSGSAYITDIDKKDTFKVNDTTYIKESVGLMKKDNQLLTNVTVNASVAVESLESDSSIWKNTAILSSGEILTIPSGSSGNKWLVLDNGKSEIYGTVTAGDNKAYTVSKEDGKNFNVTLSGAGFYTDSKEFTVTAATSSLLGATIDGASNVTQTGGRVAIQKGQTIKIGDTANSVKGTGSNVVVNGNNIELLDTNDTFIVNDDKEYTLVGSGRIIRDSDKCIFNPPVNGSVDVSVLIKDNNWLPVIETDYKKRLTIDSEAIDKATVNPGAYGAFIHEKDNPSAIYGKLTPTSLGASTYQLKKIIPKTTDDTISAIEFFPPDTASKVSISSDFKGTPIIVGNTEFVVDSVSSGDWKVNYTNGGDSGDTVSVTNASGITLNKGTLYVTSSQQTITAGKIGDTITRSAGTISVAYNDRETVATVALDKEKDAASIAGTGYTLIAKNKNDVGINVEIGSNKDKTITGITPGDEFKIGEDSYKMTDTNLLVKGSQLWTGDVKNSIPVTDLQNENNWETLIAVTDGKLTISGSTTGILVDDTSNPTIIYGQMTNNVLGTCTIGGTTKKPDSITVNGVSATISSDFGTVPVKLENNATVNYNEINTVSGAVESVVFNTMTFTPEVDDEFTLDGITYHMYDAGLTKKDKDDKDDKDKIWIWADAVADKTYTGLTLESNWLPMLTLYSDGTLNLSGSQKPTEGKENIIVDNSKTTRLATLTYTANSRDYVFNSTDGNTVDNIKLPADTLTATTDFETTIDTGKGTYTINDKIYTTSSDTDALTVKTTANSSSKLYSGTVSIDAGSAKAVTSGSDKITSTKGTITATAQNGKWTSIGQLNEGDTFTINDETKYQVRGSTENLSLVQLDSDGMTPVSAYKNFIKNKTFNYSDLSEGNFLVLKELEEDGLLNLTKEESSYATEYLVVQKDKPASRVAKLEFDDSTYTLSERSDGSFTFLKGVKLSQKIPSFINNTAKTVAVTTKEIGEYTINGQSLYAEKDSAFKTYANTVILTSGTVTLVTDRDYASVLVNDGNDTITATNGKVIVKVDDSTDVITVGELDDGDEFSFNSAGYLKSKIGLANSEKTKLNTTVKGSVNSIDTANLPTTGTDWKDVENAPKGNLTIYSDTPSDGYVVDLDNPKNAVYYGTIAKESNTYTYTGDKLASVTLDTAVKANVVLNKNCAGIDITANGATFQVKASNTFTVDATGTTNITGATAITLKSGTIQATEGIKTTAGGYEITMATGSNMTIDVSGSKVTIGDVAIDETFTVNDGTESKTYVMKEAGLCLTDESNNPTHIDTTGVTVSDGIATVTLNSLKVGYILKADTSDQLDFTNKDNTPQSGSNIVVNSDETKRLVNLNYSNNTYAFTKDEGTLTEIKLPDGTLTATTNFDSTIKTGNGTYTVNKLSYKGSGLEIKAIADTSTLYNGTVSLSTNDSVTATVDGELVDVSGNGFEATVKDGSFTELTNFNTGDSFTYKYGTGTATYLQTDCGLKRTTTDNVDTINEKLTDTTLKFSKLDEEDNFIGFLAPVDGTLNLTGNKDDAEAIVFDNTDSPTVKLGKFTIKDDGMLTLKGEDTAPAQITTVAIDPGKKFSVDFVTQVEVAAGEVTVNKKTFVGQKKLTLDSDGKTSTLYEGTITLNTTNPSAQATNDTTALKVTAVGDITAVAEEGKFTDVKNLMDGDKFTFSEHTYTKSAVGLMRDDKTICEDLGSSVDIEELLATSTVWQNYIAPTNKAIDLTGASNALVVDNTTLLTKKLGTLTVDSENQVITFESENATDSATAITNLTIAADTELVVDFATDIAAPIGSVIVNDAYYNGTSALTIHSDGTTSTLTEGTITLSSNGTVTTTTSNTTVNATGGSSGGLLMANSSDILTVNVDSNGKINLSDMTVGTSFIVGDNTYKVTTVGVMNSNGKIWTASDYKEGIADAVTELVDDDNWTTVMAVSENLTIDDNTIAVGDKFVLVDNASNPTKRYGVLSKAAEDDYYLATSDIDTDPTSITVDKTKIEIGDDFADVPINTINGDGSNTKFTVTVEDGKTTFIVAAEDYAAEADNVSDVELEEGPFKPKDGQNVDIADGADKDKIQILLEDGEHTIGGKTFTLAGSQSQAMATVDDNGKLAKISNLVSGATVTPKDAGVDGGTCTSTADGTTLNYSDTDGYYFDGLTKDAYNISVDAGGHVTVDAGVAFTKVVSSGRTLDDTATIKTAVDTATIPVTVTNNGTTGINISDTVDDLAKNFSKQSGVVFNADGVTANDFTAAKGTTFIADKGQTVAVGEDFKVVAGTDNVEVTIGDNAAAVDKMATITAPTDFGLTLAAAEYTVNDLAITPSGTLNLTTTADGVIVDLATSEPFIYDEMTFSGTGTAEFAKDKNATLTSGAIVTNAIDKELTVDGIVTVDGKTINAAEPTDVIGTAAGLSVGDINLEVFGDDLYTVNIAESSIITGLENIGAADGVTVAGLSTATVLTDTAGPFSVDRTFNAGASVTYGIEDSVLTFADDVTTISGDFSKVLTVNDMPYTITGGTATIDTEDGTIDTGAGTFNINGKTYTTSEPTTWTTDNGTVTGADLSADGTLAIRQNETDFDINGDSLTLTNNSRPVTLAVDSQSGVTEARGINGIISGLDDATVYDVARATIDSTPIYVRNDSVDAVVANGSVSQLTGLNSGAVVNSAPSMTVTSAENGNFTFVGDRYNVTDADNSVDFITDENSRVTNIGKLEGSLSGNGVKDVTVNDKDFTTSDGNVTIASDGTDITAIDGLASGDTIGGDLEEATFTMPEGQLTMNSAAYTLAGDENGVTMSDDGKRIAGFAREASLTVGEAGSYTINGTRFNANAGDTFTSNRDGVYKFDPNNPPINDTTPASEILALSDNPVYVNSSSSSVQVLDLSDEKTLALIDSPNGNTSVKTGMGNDSVIARHGGNITVDVADGDATIVPTSAKVTLDNYRSDGDAAIKTYEYTNIPGAIKSNDILFGDGVMTLGDAVINFGSTSATSGATFTNIINTTNQKQAVGFTHTAGGTADVSEESSAYVLKGNYAESDSDTQKTAGSTLLGGSGNDTLLIGAGDVADAGDGTNQIYVTDPSLRAAAATIVLNAGKNTVYKFSGGHDSIDDRIQVSSLNDVEFGYGSGLTMTSGDAILTFNGLKPSDDLVTVTGANAILNAADPYKIRLTAGNTTYNAEIAQSGKGLGVAAGDTGNLFYGNGNGISFSEFTGNVSVNLNENSGSVGGRSARFYNFDKVAAGAGNSTLIGENGVSNTLMAGTGNGVIRSGSGADLMVGTDGYDNTGRTRFYYTAGYGRDTITNFDFMASSGDTYSDYVEIGAEITGVSLQGANVVIGVEGNDDDYLTLVNAANQHFAIEGGIAKVGTNLAFDGMTDYYVGTTTNSSVNLAANMGNTEIWLGGEVGDTRYFGDISVINAANANGENILAGNSLNNMIIGGTGSNSIWGGQGANDDTLVGGSGQNTFFFMANNGNDIVRNAHDGDIVDLSNLDFNKITAADIGDNGVSIALDDGSHFTIEGRAAVDYKLSDGSTYTADHNNKTWNQK